MSCWSQIYLKLSRADRVRIIKQYKSQGFFDGASKDTVWLKFDNRAQQRRIMNELKRQVNAIPESKGQKYYAKFNTNE